MPEPPESEKIPMHAMSVRIPLDWYEELREESFKQRCDIIDLVRAAIREKYALPEMPKPKGGPPRRK